MKIGLVGYQGSGKTTLFEWLTGEPADLSAAHTGQMATAAIPDERVALLENVYHPKKTTWARLEIVDTPGLARNHEGNAARLGLIREAGCLVMVVAAFAGSNAQNDLNSFEEDLLLADLEIVSGRVQRLRESVKKPRPTRDQELAELAALEPLEAELEAGRSLVDFDMTEEQRRATRSFRLLTEKPKLIVISVADNESNPQRYLDAAPAGHGALVAPVALELELARMDEEDRAEFESELEITTPRRDDFLRAMLDASGQFVFFTAGEKEVRTWLLPKGGTAVEAAGNIHTDLARGFIRAEVMRCEDLVRLGSEREIKAAGLMRQEHKEYVVQDGDILLIRHNA